MSAPASPFSQWSKRESGVTSVSSNAAIARVTWPMSIFLLPDTFSNSAAYCGIVSRTWIASSWVKAISPGLAIGPPACSWRLAARPSQNWARFMLELSTVGELIGPRCQLCPIEVLRLSVPPMLRLWQELQEMKPDFESRGSK